MVYRGWVLASNIPGKAQAVSASSYVDNPRRQRDVGYSND